MSPEESTIRGREILSDPSCPCLSFSFFFSFFFPPLFRAATGAYGSSQDRGQIGATAASLRHSHSNPGPEPHLRPTPQLIATPDP